MKRLLRFDDKTPERYVLRQLGEWSFLQKDLIPIFLTFAKNRHVVQAVLELIVPLTWPVDEKSFMYANEQLQHLQAYRIALMNEKVLQITMELLLEPLAKQKKDRTEHDAQNVRLLLNLIRNMLYIDNMEMESKSSGGTLVRMLGDVNLLDLLITLAGSMDDSWIKEYAGVVLEIFYLILGPHEPSELFKEHADWEEQQIELALKPAAATATRNPRFKGVYSVVVGNENRYVVQGTHAANDLAKTLGKTHKAPLPKKGKKRNAPDVSEVEQKPTMKHLTKQEKAVLINLADMFLESSLNLLFEVVKNDLIMERDRVTDDDYTRFAKLSIFFLEYMRVARQSEPIEFPQIAVLLDLKTLGLFLRKVTMAKEESQLKHLQLTIKTLTKWILLVEEMSHSIVAEERGIAQGLQGNLFYREEELIGLQNLVKTPLVLERAYLEDVVELIHHLIKFLERYSKDNKNLFVLRKAKRRKKDDNDEEMEQTIDKQALKEYRFEFSRIERRLANENTLDTYFLLLQQPEKLRRGTVHYITKMLHRLFVKMDVDALMFKINYLYDFQAIMNKKTKLQLKNKEFRDLVGFIRYFVTRFLSRAKDNPALFVDVFFPKARGEWLALKADESEDEAPAGKSASEEERDNDEVSYTAQEAEEKEAFKSNSDNTLGKTLEDADEMDEDSPVNYGAIESPLNKASEKENSPMKHLSPLKPQLSSPLTQPQHEYQVKAWLSKNSSNPELPPQEVRGANYCK